MCAPTVTVAAQADAIPDRSQNSSVTVRNPSGDARQCARVAAERDGFPDGVHVVARLEERMLAGGTVPWHDSSNR